MPRKWLREFSIQPRVQWMEEQLVEAVSRITRVQTERYYGIPARALDRRMKSRNLVETGLGPSGTFCPENEKRLVPHIQKLSSSGFAPDRTRCVLLLAAVLLLILDGHTPQNISLDLLLLADDNGGILLCLPPHSKQALQPVNRAFFVPLKAEYNDDANSFMNITQVKKNKNQACENGNTDRECVEGSSVNWNSYQWV
ncbi:hypothetical protein PR048_031705 [Dryococelus australis]|uniref:DDE-1 domain-containing protein n=1 Tax=Dryococelus australis TaxID=614101 RepID=A0ABQ9G8Y7_9NEOP|nr:hypothetical protein PR048_031705 [Dryococelus australis]